MVASHHSPTPAANDAPHELLGIPADERDPVRIVSAAAARLRILAAANGSETDVRRRLTASIRAARDALLRAAATP